MITFASSKRLIIGIGETLKFQTESSTITCESVSVSGPVLTTLIQTLIYYFNPFQYSILQ